MRINIPGLNIFVSMLFGPSILGVNPEWAEAGSAWVQVAQAFVTPMSWLLSTSQGWSNSSRTSYQES